jgi:hypothetical protein
LKANIIGIIGGICAFISLVLPWWTMTESGRIGNTTTTTTVSIYTYTSNMSTATDMGFWYAWTAFVLIILGGSLGMSGSLVKTSRLILVAGGLLALLSIVVFAVGLQTEISKLPIGPVASLFSSGSFTTSFFDYSYTINYSAYLFVGFWLALVSTISILAASLRKPETSGRP